MKALLLITLLLAPLSVLADDLDTIIKHSGIEKVLNEANQNFIQDTYKIYPDLLMRSDTVDRFFSENVAISNFKHELVSLLNENFNNAELKTISSALSDSEKETELFRFYGTELGQRWLSVSSQFSDIVLLGAVNKVMNPESGLNSFLQQESD
ncbi:hypothetical protein [Microbulbifer aggregans]|uniref:hypothetical protein n=1 Tax=Microbulbifer aggregans TaxID=1769779 RepID=UPI001CFCCB08|nr:hypothetical protein [Microbulbifer aggregans]